MNKQTLVVIVAAVVLLGAGILGALSFTSGGSETPMMTMPDGSTMPADEMGSTGMHTMPDGTTMPGAEMTP